MSRTPLSRHAFPLVLLLALVLPIGFADDDAPLTGFLATPITAFDGFFQTPWGCNVPNFGNTPDPGTQSVLQFHFNWHCNNRDNTGANWGNRFFGFHKQFGLGYNQYRAAQGFPYTQTWVAAPNALIPPRHRGRAANTPCAGCEALPSQYRVPAAGGSLTSFTTVNDIGNQIVGWHNRNHGNIAQAGGTGGCSGGSPDMNCPRISPRDPIFYMYHHVFDDIQNAWRTFQPTDIMLVFDRSGSMSLPAAGGGTRLQAATAAANLFADLLEDGGSHRVGLVSFSTVASSPADLALTPAAGAPAAMGGALAGVTAGGNTSIGDGLQKAMATLGGGGNARKAILLLTDGMENTAPMIADVQASLGDTHLCSVGFGTPGSLDGPKLRTLSERQGGIYISTQDPLELKKFFVECFANIFDTFIGKDPIEVLGAGELSSSPVVHTALGDDKLVFVLSWADGAAPLRLQITSPSGQLVDLSDPAVESEAGASWHIVRFPLPLMGEGDGDWQAQAVRAPRGFVNGFMSDAFVDLPAGADLIRAQLRLLCAGGCGRVLYYEDEATGMDMTFGMMLSAYSEALYSEAASGTVGEVTRLYEPQEFAERLRQGDFDLLVYSSRYTDSEQPYDDLLVQTLCREDAPRAIVSDNRQSGAALEALRCAGAAPTGDTDFDLLRPGGELGARDLEMVRPEMAVLPFTYALEPVGGAGSVLATGPDGQPVVVARPVRGEDESFFITTLTRAASRVLPFTWIGNTYTGERLHPAFHIPEMYWPAGGYNVVKAVVEVTRPLRSLGELAAEVGAREPERREGDLIDARTAALLQLDPTGAGALIPTETLTFELFDDGSGGDTTAGDRYWEAALPPEVAEFDGDYRLHAIFTLCQGATCVQREASHTLEVATRLSPDTTSFDLEPLQPLNGRAQARILITPRDGSGRPVGPGLAHTLLVTPSEGAQVDGVRDADGRGAYELLVSWPEGTAARVQVSQFGRPEEVIKISLP